jgi:protein-tyrosine phosphatase
MAVAQAAELPPPREPGLPYRVCLVCLGNICRSPMAETVLRAELASAGLEGLVAVDSAGTGDWHVGDSMDPGARAALATRGHDGSAHRARQFQPSWLSRRDLILAMDQRNLADLRRMARGRDADRIRLFGEVGGLIETPGGLGPAAAGGQVSRVVPPGGSRAPGGGDIPDPWGGGPGEFGRVLDLLGAAAPVIAGRLAQLLQPGSGTGPADDASRRTR